VHECAAIIVFPRVIGAAQPALHAEREARARIAVDEARAAMPAHVEERAYLSVAAAQQHGRAARAIEAQRRARGGQVGDVAGGLPARAQQLAI
jgi:hypothetical protein